MEALFPEAQVVAEVDIDLIVEGVMTGDRRLFLDGSVELAPAPLPLLLQLDNQPEHLGGVYAGVITETSMVDGKATGRALLMDGPGLHGSTAASLIEAGVLKGVSIDGDSGEGEMVESADDGFRIEFSRVRVRGATIVPFPAFAVETQIKLNTTRPEPTEDDEAVAEEGNGEVRIPLAAELLTAAVQLAAPNGDTFTPKAELFTDPKLSGPTPLTYDETTGRISGHLAQWGVCHVGITDRCVMAPASATDYAYFLVHEIETTDGPQRVGVLTAGTGHADHSTKGLAAAAHYDDTGYQTAFVNAGEDAHGIWVSGVVNPKANAEQIVALSSPLSGDWRRIGKSLELVAALHVNTPGFPLPRFANRDGVVASLTAAGVLVADGGGADCSCGGSPEPDAITDAPEPVTEPAPAMSTGISPDTARTAIEGLAATIGHPVTPSDRIAAFRREIDTAL